VKPVLLAAVVTMTGNVHAAKMETVACSRGRMFGVGTRLPAGRSEVRIPMWERGFFSISRQAYPKSCLMGTGCSSVWSKETWDFYHSVLSCADNEHGWSCTSTPLYVFMV
jgi:hypothetical protein